ncbi:cysteine--tRNA ligase [Massilia sp. R2A-15]|uniref:cysteine--tRNA ligase n=1 Tax=Massilia sp. R2A-15 TaxID=3064278 RepID=UPI00273648EC|nr:cysteine--tRNA ligase [Massilia sp. R2A-15]WLI90515.1 cysteine--tRNA ligase [Massilia sp. R2A-15]
MELKLYDTYERKLRPFGSLESGRAGLYACGPTVYDYAHIGNLRTYLFGDTLRRVLAMNGYEVAHVINITDVGHLTSDGDTGEDKMEKGSRRTRQSAWEIAEFYTKAFEQDLAHLHILAPTVWARATDHIPEQIAFIAEIERKGFSYRTADGIYFDTQRLDRYGHLARLNIAGQQAGHRVDIGDKRSLTDFALWKFSGAEQRQMEWDSPWGRGFPGWHIECSAMSTRYLGALFDIHIGGEDHISVHHSNEIAQHEACHDHPPARYWLHGAFLKLEGGDKMSKSDGGFLRLATLMERGFDPMAYRYLVLSAHYRSPLAFSWDALDAAQTALGRLRQAYYRLPAEGQPDPAYKEAMLAELNHDLNTAKALALMWEVLKSSLPGDVQKATISWLDQTLGLNLDRWVPAAHTVPQAVQALIAARDLARSEKRWADADSLRAHIEAEGFAVRDTAAGTVAEPR